MILSEYIASLKKYKGFRGDIVCHRTLDRTTPCFSKKTPKLSHDPEALLKTLGIDRLYAHQQKAVDMICKGTHTVIATPTASGKSLVYNLPVIDAVLDNPEARALYLFPLKALARDQLDTVRQLLKTAQALTPEKVALTAEVYDGDISAYKKAKIRRAPPQVLLTNPEMLHLAMLAHHHLWADFFARLSYVVIDEVHTYRGVMGSNMAWVFRRLIRICRHYGSDPVFVFCSATIANPAELCGRLTGLDVKVVDTSGAPSGQKDVLLMRGLEGAAQTAIALIHAAVHRQLRTIVYTQSRKITELIAIWASQRAKGMRDKISAYRAGFLPEERREIEQKMASGELLAVVSTSALELGIDIGALDLCILVGYPGTMMSTWQRAGRVGRAGRESAMILIANEDALDQYFINHPDEFFLMPPETAMINPDNPMIMESHLECAAVELTLRHDEPFLNDPGVLSCIKGLEHQGRLLKSREGTLWYGARKAPHREVSLRGTGRSIPIFNAHTRESLGEIDRHRAFFETHEGAVYLHRGKTYVVTRLDYEKGAVEAQEQTVSYYTRARSSKTTHIMEVLDSRRVGRTRVFLGNLKIVEQVTGFEKKTVAGQKSLGIFPLDLPQLTFETQGLWIEIPDKVRDEIEYRRLHFMGGIHALEHAAIGIMPLLVMTDRNDLGGISIPFHPQVEKAAVFIYDGVPGGLGLSGQAFTQAVRLLNKTFDAIGSCGCETGCPACVHSPKCGSGNRPIDKAAALAILELICGDGQGEAASEGDEKPFFKTVPRGPEKAAEKRSDQKNKVRRYGVLDIETRRSAAEVGGWNKAERMGVSIAVLYDSGSDTFHDFHQDEVAQLVDHLKQLDLVIGFNIIRFDYKVLSGLSDFNFHRLSTLDILLKVHEVLGYRLSLDHLARQTLGQKKSADGLMALKWWKQGKMDEIIHYCRQDVQVTRDLYRFGKDHQYLLFKNKAGNEVRVPVSW